MDFSQKKIQEISEIFQKKFKNLINFDQISFFWFFAGEFFAKNKK